MKKLLCILSILLSFNCRNINKTGEIKKDSVANFVATIKSNAYEIDTLKKVSKPFKLNNMVCYWEHFFEFQKNDSGTTQIEQIKMTLRNFETKKALSTFDINPIHSAYYDYKSSTYFETFNKGHFIDLNFDGFKDFTIYYEGSTPMSATTNIYLFNNKTKTFEDSELSDTSIEEVDPVNKILTTFSWDLEARYIKKHHFGKNGKIKFSAHITEENYSSNDTTLKVIRTYQKMINGKEVEIKVDTVEN